MAIGVKNAWLKWTISIVVCHLCDECVHVPLDMYTLLLHASLVM